MPMGLTIKDRLRSVLANLEGISEDAATAIDEAGVHPQVGDEISTAMVAIEQAIALT